MHSEPRAFLQAQQRRYSWHFSRVRVLECGSYSINGSARDLFTDSDYTGLDWRPGPNVDVVGLVHEHQPAAPYDVVVSTEMLEHDPHWQASLTAMVGHLAPGGALFVTWASPHRPAHEVDCAPADGYYRGLSAAEVLAVVTPLAKWHTLETRTVRHGLDCQLLAVKPLVSAVVGTLGQPALVNCCIQELRRWAKLPLEIVVVDNGSTPREQGLIATMDHDVLCRYDTPLGYAAANNVGIAASNGRFVLLCNNDAWPTAPGWDVRLVSVLDSVPAAGLVSPVAPRVWLPDQNKSVAQDTAAQLVQIDRLSFVAPLLRRTTLDAIGPLDERFGAGTYEDDDYCMRLGKAGKRILIDPATLFFHVGSVTMKTLDMDGILQHNYTLFEEKWRNA